MQGAVNEFEGRVQSLVEELEFTRSNYKIACKEIAELKEELMSLGNEQEQQQLLVLEVRRVGVVSMCEHRGGSYRTQFV